MSWSVGFIGKPANVTAALDGFSEKLSDLSKEEYDAAKPSIIALVNQNFGDDNTIVKVSASGHGTTIGDKPQRYLSCNVERFYVELV
jgi:hypothetical protein